MSCKCQLLLLVKFLQFNISKIQSIFSHKLTPLSCLLFSVVTAELFSHPTCEVLFDTFLHSTHLFHNKWNKFKFMWCPKYITQHFNFLFLFLLPQLPFKPTTSYLNYYSSLLTKGLTSIFINSKQLCLQIKHHKIPLYSCSVLLKKKIFPIHLQMTTIFTIL